MPLQPTEVTVPESPEAEFFRRLLHSTVGATVSRVALYDSTVLRAKLGRSPADRWPTPEQWAQAMSGATSMGTDRVGKRIAWRFDRGALLIHLGMTGRWSRAESPPKHSRLGVFFSDSSGLFFVDPRRFGALCPHPLADIDHALRRDLGPDPTLHTLTGEQLKARLFSKRNLKTALMDQKRLAGLGNIHVVESLWRAQISPFCRCDAPVNWDRLAHEIRAQLIETIDALSQGPWEFITDGGSNPFKVYAQENAPCPRCEQPIRRVKTSGRSTFWCERCQVAPNAQTR